MSEIIIITLSFVVLALLSFIYYLFFWRRSLIKHTITPIEIETFLITLNKQFVDQFKETDKHIKNLEKNHEKHEKDILKKISSGADDLKVKLDRLKKYTHNEVKEIINRLDALTQSEREIAEKNKLNLQKTDKCIRDNLLPQITEIKNQLDALQEYALEKNQKIRRFEDGYDLKIQNEFIRDIISTIEYMEKQNRESRNNVLAESIEELNIMLENNGIYKIEVNTDNYKGQEKIAKVVSTEPTNDTSKNGAIKEVSKDGYYVEVGESEKIIKPAQIVIYKIEEK